MGEPKPSPFETHLDPNPANYAALTPLGFLERSASVYPDRISVIHGEERYRWAETRDRCRRLASALRRSGVVEGDTVSILAPNVPAIYEASFAVPMAGAVLNAINTRLDAATVAFILEHGRAKLLITDRELSPVARDAVARLGRDIAVVDIDDPTARSGELIGVCDYETFLGRGDPEFDWQPPRDEWQAISLNYTSGTTGNPKGVVYHHRGAYLNALSNAIGWQMGAHPVYLWTLPMFHCNGWCFPWTIAALGGTNVCLRRVEAGAHLRRHRRLPGDSLLRRPGSPQLHPERARGREAHLCPSGRGHDRGGASSRGGARGNGKSRFPHDSRVRPHRNLRPGGDLRVEGGVGWAAGAGAGRAEGAPGVRYHVLEGLDVMDPETMHPVPRDGATTGEVMFRGNIVMKGYLANPNATDEALGGGWFHSGDLAVMHPDGYLQLKDRIKDIIISGGENISSIEVEDALYRHPAVLEAAVVARPDATWGETPCAFVTLKEGAQADEREIINFCRNSMAHFKAPKSVIFGPLPKTSTGKIQKFKLRQRFNAPAGDRDESLG